eukprot:Nk52_evm25s2612 gene=Nk52_evmTU25s2612
MESFRGVVKGGIVPYAVSLVLSPRLREVYRGSVYIKEVVMGRGNVLDFFFKVDDPYSHPMLVSGLLPFARKHNLYLKIHVVQEQRKEFYSELEKFKEFALLDSQNLSEYFGLKLPSMEKYPTSNETKLANRLLCSLRENTEEFVDMSTKLYETLWRNAGAVDGQVMLEELCEKSNCLSEEDTSRVLCEGDEYLKNLGQYTPGSVAYAGEFYPKLDRLCFLSDRFQKENFWGNSDPFGYPQSINSQDKELDFYFSFRSPYSYLALERAIRFGKMFNLSINIKPVLPMVMRGLPVPPEKKKYIVHDCSRIAHKLGIPFGKICDPVGQGALNCIALFTLAKDVGVEKELTAALASGIWSQGLDTTNHENLKRLTSKLGLEWSKCQERIEDKDVLFPVIQKNTQDLHRAGLWGVPSFRVGSSLTWGQDRLWALGNTTAQK